MAQTSEHITIIGAGLAGSLLACFLARRGFRVTIFERRSDPRIKGFLGGRSINLALSARGIHALQRAGLADRVMQSAIPMKGRMVHDPLGACSFQPYSSTPTDAINSVSRGGLNLILLHAAADHHNVQLVFDHRCIGVDLDRSELRFETADGVAITRPSPGPVIGADGAFSAVRLAMMLRMDRLDYRQDYLPHGYKELHIPPVADSVSVGPHSSSDPFAMEKHALHIWPRGSSMMIALPNIDGSFTCTLFWPITGPGGLDSLRSESEVLAHFQLHYPDAVPLMPTLAHDFFANPVGNLLTVHCSPWHLEDRALVLGDAAHAIVPFYGQGMNCAFEDVVAFDECLEQFGPDWRRVFTDVFARRKPHADAIADMALENFVEMRDHVASRAFRLKKHAEQILHKLFPSAFLPLYNMISFSTIPYAQARARALRQKWILAQIFWFIVLLAVGVVLAVLALLLWR